MKRILFVFAFLSLCCSPADAQGVHNGHQWVDLGLPSGLKWATCNVGANNPQDYGDYYAWGETYTKSTYTEDNSASYLRAWGDIGGDSSRDAARANWGGSWRMPTKDEFEELKTYCTWTWSNQNGNYGYWVTSEINGMSIFIPAAGACRDGSINGIGTNGFYSSSTPYEHNDYGCYNLSFINGYIDVPWGNRLTGCSVRPVLGISGDVKDYAQYSHNPIVTRITEQEIAACETPSSVAYNVVMAILNKDWVKLESLMEYKYFLDVKAQHITAEDYENAFSVPGSKLNILGWIPALIRDYEVAVLYVQDEGTHSGRPCLKVYIDCVPSSEVNRVGFQDITRDNGTNVKPLVVWDGEAWKFVGFK